MEEVEKSLLYLWLSCIQGDNGRHKTGEMLACEREPRNAQDRYAVAVKKKEGTVIGHLSRVCSLFIRQGGTITCTVTGKRRFSALY